MLNNYEKMQEMEAVLASVLPAGALGEDAAEGLSGSSLSGQKENGEGLSGAGGQASQVVVEEIKGNLEPRPRTETKAPRRRNSCRRM